MYFNYDEKGKGFERKVISKKTREKKGIYLNDL